MLARAHRLTSGADFTAAVRRGRRAGGTTLVVHLAVTAAATDEQDVRPAPPRAGLVVSRSVGRAVTRNQVKRRLRHLLRNRVGRLPDGALLVVRALPPAAEASSTQLGEELDRALDRVLAPRRTAAGPASGGRRP